MGTLTISAAGFSSGPNGSKVYTLTDADWQNLITYSQARYKANPANDGTPAPDLTPTQALLAWVNSWVTQTRDEIHSVQLRAAQQTATAAVDVPPIVFG